MAKPLAPGAEAPDFEAVDQHGKTHRLRDYRGQPVALYFYPKDDTPGCTAEACAFRDRADAYEAAGVQVLGVSVDDAESHAAFAKKHGLDFPLLDDSDKAISKAYGTYRMLLVLPVARRVTYLIDGQGVVRHVWDPVDPRGHAAEVLEAARELGLADAA